MAAQKSQPNPNSSEWSQIDSILDEAMSRLSGIDRTILLLRYWQDQSTGELAAAARASVTTPLESVFPARPTASASFSPAKGQRYPPAHSAPCFRQTSWHKPPSTSRQRSCPARPPRASRQDRLPPRKAQEFSWPHSKQNRLQSLLSQSPRWAERCTSAISSSLRMTQDPIRPHPPPTRRQRCQHSGRSELAIAIQFDIQPGPRRESSNISRRPTSASAPLISMSLKSP